VKVTEAISHLVTVLKSAGDIDVEMPDPGCGCCSGGTVEPHDIYVCSPTEGKPYVVMDCGELADWKLDKGTKGESIISGRVIKPSEL